MKRKFKIILFIIFFLFPVKSSFSEELLEANEIKACNNFYKSIKNDELPFLKGLFPSLKYNDYGFYLHQIWDSESDEWITPRDEEGNFTVGEIYSYDVFDKIKFGDSIISINGKKILTADDFNNFYFDEIENVKIELKNKKNETYTVDLKLHYNDYEHLYYSIIDLNVTDIDLKKSFYEVSIDQAYQFNYKEIDNTSDENHEFVKLAKKYLIGKLTESSEEDYFHICQPTHQEMIDYEINNPLLVSILNVIRDDNDLHQKNYEITPYAEPRNPYDALRIEARTKNVQVVKNYFNLRSFPFDRQVLQYKIVTNYWDLSKLQLYPQQFTYETLDNFMKRDDIPGWSKEKYTLEKFFYRDSVDPKNFGRDGVLINIELERKHGYYIFKVILPIVLILIVCWSVVWIDPREIEARLTITIVCLLSLIAYNFVIDEELPKLEYLTVMDWIVLTSYVYATLPNFLSIYSFKNKSNSILTSKVDALSKRFGITSYVVIILLIIFLNANLNPDNSSAFIGWMAFR